MGIQYQHNVTRSSSGRATQGTLTETPDEDSFGGDGAEGVAAYYSCFDREMTELDLVGLGAQFFHCCGAVESGFVGRWGSL